MLWQDFANFYLLKTQNSYECICDVSIRLRSQSYFYNYNNPRTVFYWTETLWHLGAKIWNILLVKIKTTNNLHMFKANIKTWVPTNCPCRLCIPYVRFFVLFWLFLFLFSSTYNIIIIFFSCKFILLSKPA